MQEEISAILRTQRRRSRIRRVRIIRAGTAPQRHLQSTTSYNGKPDRKWLRQAKVLARTDIVSLLLPGNLEQFRSDQKRAIPGALATNFRPVGCPFGCCPAHLGVEANADDFAEVDRYPVGDGHVDAV